MILVKVGHRFSCFYRRKSERKQYLLGCVFIIENVEVRLIENDSRKYRDIVGLYVCLC